MPKLRTYFVKFDGRTRIVKAASPHRAERHVLNIELAKLEKKLEGVTRVANGMEVADFVSGGGRIESEGEVPIEERAPLLDSLRDVAGEAMRADTENEANVKRWPSCACGVGPTEDETVFDNNGTPRCPRCNTALGGDPMTPAERAEKDAGE